MKISKKDVLLYIFSSLLLVFITYIIIGGIVNKESLGTNMEYAKAVVTDHFYTSRYTSYFSYEFNVNGEIYKGSGLLYPKSDTLSAGDSIVVVFDRKNPNSNRVFRDY